MRRDKTHVIFFYFSHDNCTGIETFQFTFDLFIGNSGEPRDRRSVRERKGSCTQRLQQRWQAGYRLWKLEWSSQNIYSGIKAISKKKKKCFALDKTTFLID